MVLAGQDIIDFSNEERVQVTARNAILQIGFNHRMSFPPRTTGVLYFQHIPGSPFDFQLRIRLCKSVEHFARGSDLLVKVDKPWNISLRRIQAVPSYHPLLIFIREANINDGTRGDGVSRW